MSLATPSGGERGHRETGRIPRRSITVQITCPQIVALQVVSGITDQVLQPPLATAKSREWQPDITLALVGGIGSPLPAGR
jgi:hypothetical protein